MHQVADQFARLVEELFGRQVGVTVKSHVRVGGDRVD
jgi:hypothetical protein